MTPELRLFRYFVAVGLERNVTRAAERLHISQPSLSAAIKQLEGQLGARLLERRGRNIELTSAGELLLPRAQKLLAQAEAVVDAVRTADAAASGRVRLGLTPTARYGLGPEVLAACAAEAPAVMIYSSEDTTGALLRDVAQSRLDLAITFCAGDPPAGVELTLLRAEPAVVHMPADHPLADRGTLLLEDLAAETVLIAASSESGGFTERILAALRGAGVSPRTEADPYPDLGLQAVRERVGVVIYARSAFPDELPGSAFVPLEPPLTLPFHLAVRSGPESAAVRTACEIAASLAPQAAR